MFGEEGGDGEGGGGRIQGYLVGIGYGTDWV